MPTIRGIAIYEHDRFHINVMVVHENKLKPIFFRLG